jgi:superfamily II DNA or RNA helicase
MVLTEGWDMPEVSCVVLARPTKHTGLFRQMIGRVLRPAQGKPDALVLDHAGAVFQHGFVEEAVGWTLDADKRAKNATHEARAHGGPASRICKCPKCDALRIGGEACPMCGWKPTPKPRSVDVADGELGRLDRNGNTRHQYASPEIRVQWHRQLLWIARDRGYKDGWAAHKYKEKFGSWPANRTVAPEAPSGEIKSWVRSRQIAYAKAIQKAETETSGASA